jgi:hypothetical protein
MYSLFYARNVLRIVRIQRIGPVDSAAVHRDYFRNVPAGVVRVMIMVREGHRGTFDTARNSSVFEMSDKKHLRTISETHTGALSDSHSSDSPAQQDVEI